MTPVGTWSLRARLTAWYTLALMTVLVFAGLVVLWQQGRLGQQRVDRDLDALSVTTVNLLHDEVSEHPDLESAAVEVIDLVAPHGHAVVILNEKERVIGAHWEGLTSSALAHLPVSGGPTSLQSGSDPWRVLARREAFGTATLTVLVASPLSEALGERRAVADAMWIGIPLAMILAAVGGLWLAAIGLRPITVMAQRVASMPLDSLQDLGESERADELGQFARAFNGLVGRVRTTLTAQRQFMADASHELRTPVSVIRSAADVTLSRSERDEGEYREALTIVRSEARRASRLVEDMLVLGRADAGGYQLRRTPLDLVDLVDDCRRAVDVLACEGQVTLVTRRATAGDAQIPLAGDEDLLRRMLVNLLQNAVEHSPREGVVTIDLCRGTDDVSIAVTDHGPGIPIADRERIFDRFVQLEPSRRGAGAGLGLPIARWIADAHGGSLSLATSSPAGTTFRVVLPFNQRSSSGR